MALTRRLLQFRTFSRRIAYSCNAFSSKRSYSSDKKTTEAELKDILDYKFDQLKSKDRFANEKLIPYESDIVVVGGGAVGLATAYWLKQLNPNAYKVTVIEKDTNYREAATILSLSGFTEQLGSKENIEMALFSAEFYRKISQYLSVTGVEPPNIHFNHQGFLSLATEQNAKELYESFKLQNSLNVKLDMMDRKALEKKFPGINFSDVEFGCYGLQDEGWFNPWLLLASYKLKAAALGVEFVTGEVTEFITETFKANSLGTKELEDRHRLRSLMVRTKDDQVHDIKFAMCVNCGGPWSRDIARMAGIGTAESGPMSVELPIEPKRRYVYVFHCQDGPGIDFPVLVDPTGVFVRREGLAGDYICGATLPLDMVESEDHEKMGQMLFESLIRPVLSQRIPAFQNIELLQTHSGLYDHNSFDGEMIIGNHPYHRNFFMATGFDGQGMQLSPAIGRALMEYMLRDGYEKIDLTKFMFDRVISGEQIPRNVHEVSSQ